MDSAYNIELAKRIEKRVKKLPNPEFQKKSKKVQPLKDLFHITHFSRFYRLYIPASILIGIVCGLFMVAFQIMIDSTTYLFSSLPIFITPILGGALSGIFIKLGRTEIQGSGISEAIELTQWGLVNSSCSSSRTHHQK
ncbi:MAG: hypothetical protein ACFFEE_08325, partial [Candidatus Thorarchaeota archaeon]